MTLSERDIKLLNANRDGLNMSNQYDIIRNPEQTFKNVINISKERTVYGKIQIIHTYNKGKGVMHRQYELTDLELQEYIKNNSDAIVNNKMSIDVGVQYNNFNDNKDSNKCFSKHLEYNNNTPNRLESYRNTFFNKYPETNNNSKMDYTNISGNFI
jgi:hypothetical protein